MLSTSEKILQLRRFASKKILQHLENIVSEKFQEHFEKILIAYNKPA